MAKQKKKERKNKGFQALNLSEKQLRNRWIIVTGILIILFILAIVLSVLLLTGKININTATPFAKGGDRDKISVGSSEQKEMLKEHMNKYNDIDFKKLFNEQMAKPQQGEEIIEIYFVGSDKPIKAKLFEKEVPEIVKQFKQLVKNGYYNNKEIKGSPLEGLLTAIGDRSIKWDTMEVKTHEVLPYGGALCAYGYRIDEKNFDTVNFLILNNEREEFKNKPKYNIPIVLKELLDKNAGVLNYYPEAMVEDEFTGDNPYANLLEYIKIPTFGQVFEGMETIDKISKQDRMYTIKEIKIVKYER